MIFVTLNVILTLRGEEVRGHGINFGTCDKYFLERRLLPKIYVICDVKRGGV